MMNEENLYLKVMSNENVITDSRIKITDFGSKIKLDFYHNEIFISEMDELPFVALSKLRLKLEQFELKLICQGSRIDVSPSGMQLIGYYAYELELSKPATNSVYIFDDTKYIDKIASVKEQEIFYEEWLRSVGFSDSKDKIDIYDPKNTLGSYWSIINLKNWEIQSPIFQNGIILSIQNELKKIKEDGLGNIDFVKNEFQNKYQLGNPHFRERIKKDLPGASFNLCHVREIDK